MPKDGGIMHFILMPGSITKFDHLREDYEALKHVDLSEEPSMIGLPTFFGGADVVNRNKQITFLEKVYAVMKMHWVKEEQIKTPQQWQVNLITARFMMASCLHVLSEISSSKRRSVLYKILEDNLGITTSNFLDEEDKEACYLTANRLVNTPSAYEHSNVALQKAGLKPFTEQEWHKFTQFLKEMCQKKEPKVKPNHFPVVSITQPFFGMAFTYVGATVGIVAAEAVTNSTTALAPRVQLSALVGSTILILNPAGTTGVALLAPVIAAKLLTSFCTISLAHIMGTTMGILGQGIGIGVGVPFDVAYNILWTVCSLIGRIYSKTPGIALINGIRIADGTPIMAGIPVQLLATNELPEGYTKKLLEITEKGEISIDGEEIQDADKPMELPPEVLEELKRQLDAHTKEQETTKEQAPTTLTKEETRSDKEKDDIAALSVI
jgi:hypothetical protein